MKNIIVGDFDIRNIINCINFTAKLCQAQAYRDELPLFQVSEKAFKSS